MTYDLEAKDILRSLIRTGGGDLLKHYYTDFRETHGSRRLALEAYEDGFNPRAVRNEYGSWFDFVAAMRDLTPTEAWVRSQIGAFLKAAAPRAACWSGGVRGPRAGGLLRASRAAGCWSLSLVRRMLDSAIMLA